ncbi:MAG: aldehyde dehydrogenase family protein [Nostoc sp. CmiVER01]|uniref:aldehyde dehydrogenase family protein n=1 Tax=Nostoc sp. CmiVER01 TaxID=3075384 RepID=UPI002AD476B5|nr:aldehyde dehydrogenase family protein [Nostoc sp. CmiVER01]MDZ8123559.1 aldehyde dehydrogenase family protein [Nostoc sp. CmiVER01]
MSTTGLRLRRFETINPTTDEVICEVSQADAADVDKAVEAARTAFTSLPPCLYSDGIFFIWKSLRGMMNVIFNMGWA